MLVHQLSRGVALLRSVVVVFPRIAVLSEGPRPAASSMCLAGAVDPWSVSNMVPVRPSRCSCAIAWLTIDSCTTWFAFRYSPIPDSITPSAIASVLHVSVGRWPLIVHRSSFIPPGSSVSRTRRYRLSSMVRTASHPSRVVGRVSCPRRCRLAGERAASGAFRDAADGSTRVADQLHLADSLRRRVSRPQPPVRCGAGPLPYGGGTRKGERRDCGPVRRGSDAGGDQVANDTAAARQVPVEATGAGHAPFRGSVGATRTSTDCRCARMPPVRSD